MTTQILTVNVSGIADSEDRRTQLFMINLENSRRTKANVEIADENARRAVMNPPEAALPMFSLLPFSTGAERRISYETILSETIRKAHLSYLGRANESAGEDVAFRDLRIPWSDATPQQRAAATAAFLAAIK
jgi:hypothetical protein